MSRDDARVLLAAAAVHGLLFVALGVRHGGDTPLYLSAAATLREQGLLAFCRHHYLGAAYLLPCLALALLGPLGLVGLQLALSTASVVVLARALRALLPGRRGLAGLLVAVYLLDLDALRWGCYVLSDGLYLSLSALLLATLALPSRPAAAGFCLSLPLLCLTRPTALAVAAPLLACVRGWRRAAAVLSLGLLLLGHLAWPRDGALARDRERIFLSRFASGRIFNGHQRYNLTIGTPFSTTPASYGDALARHPLYTVKYLAIRAAVFLLPAYPHYSFRHRLYQGLYHGALYAALLIALGRACKFGPSHALARATSQLRLRRGLLLLIGGTTLLHTLTQVDPDARYLAPLHPAFVLLLSASLAGAARIES